MRVAITIAVLYVLLALGIDCASAQPAMSHSQPPTFQLAEPMQPDASTIPSGAFVTPVRVGDVVRNPGVLYSLEANAWILSEFEKIQAFWIAEMDMRVEAMYVWAEYELALQHTVHTADLESLNIRLRSREREIQTLTEINTDLRRQATRVQRRSRLKLVFIVIGTGAVAGLAGYGVGRVVQ